VKEIKYAVVILILSELVSWISITNIRVIIDIDIQRVARCGTEYIHKGQELKEEVKFISEIY
jgi:hypothetical protein